VHSLKKRCFLKENPFVFIFGVGQLLPDFEKNLLNKEFKIEIKWLVISG